MQAFTYPADVVKADFLRAGAGLALTLGPLALVGFDAHPLVGLALLAGGAVFGWLGLRTLFRRQVRYSLRADGLGIQTRFTTALLPWDRVTGVRLRYYSTKKDRSDGWMQLTLRTGRFQSTSIEGTLAGFDTIAAHVSGLVLEREIKVDAATRENFLSLGHYL